MKSEKAINASDLRLGNYVNIKNDIHKNLKDVICEVIKIEKRYSTIRKETDFNIGLEFIDNDGFDDNIGQWLKFIKPIEITNEWLQKLGFKILNKVSNSYKKYVNNTTKECFYVELYQVGRLDWIVKYFNSENNEISLKINHVHQLQNLYQILSGEHLI